MDTVEGQKPIKELVGKKGTVNCLDVENGKATTGRFHDVRQTRKHAPIYELELEDGTKIKATADHLVYTQHGWKELGKLTQKDRVIRL